MMSPEAAERLALLDRVTAERFGVVRVRCSRCDWTTNRTSRAYAESALAAHNLHAHYTAAQRRNDQDERNRRGRELAANALASRGVA